MLLTHIQTRLLRPGLAQLTDPTRHDQPGCDARAYQHELNPLIHHAGFAA